MDTVTRRPRKYPFEGIVALIQSEAMSATFVAAAIFGAVEVIGSGLLLGWPGGPVQAAASLLIRERAYEPTHLALTFLLGIVIHFSLAAFYGFAFGLATTELRARTRTKPSAEFLMGIAFGTLLWAFNFQLVARNIYPWLFNVNQPLQLLAHVGAFGLPLALRFGRMERRRLARTGPP
jgi:hypothetical protein